MALKNSESRNGPMKLPPTVDKSSRNFNKFDINDRKRLGSTPVLL